MLSIDHTLFIQIAGFLFLILILNIIVYRPIRNILTKRKELMSSSEDMTQGWNRKAEKCSEELEADMSDTNKKGLKERESLRSEGMQEEDRMLKDTYSMLEDKIKIARINLEEKRLKAGDSLQKEVNGFSKDLAVKFLGRGI